MNDKLQKSHAISRRIAIATAGVISIQLNSFLTGLKLSIGTGITFCIVVFAFMILAEILILLCEHLLLHDVSLRKFILQGQFIEGDYDEHLYIDGELQSVARISVKPSLDGYVVSGTNFKYADNKQGFRKNHTFSSNFGMSEFCVQNELRLDFAWTQINLFDDDKPTGLTTITFTEVKKDEFNFTGKFKNQNGEIVEVQGWPTSIKAETKEAEEKYVRKLLGIPFR